jgi:hypothetical protein
MNLRATLTLQNNNNDGLRIPGIANIQAKLKRSPQRTVTGDKFKKGGFKPIDWFDRVSMPTDLGRPPFPGNRR